MGVETAPSKAIVETSAAGEGGFVLTSMQSVVNWSRKNSVWPLPLGLACCAIEFMATAASRYDMARFGMEVARFSPRQADLLLVAGWLTYKMAHVMTRLYDQMAEPKWVVAMGACASTGGMHRAYPVVQGIDEFIPVDLYIPGCPPRPEAVLNALLHLQQKIGVDRGHDAGQRPPEGAPFSHGGLERAGTRGEMTPPVLLSRDETWVAGKKPRVAWGTPVDEVAVGVEDAPPHVAAEAVATLKAFDVRWDVPRRASTPEDGRPSSPSPTTPIAERPASQDSVAILGKDRWVDAVRALRDRAGFDILLDSTAVDYPDRNPRFSLVLVLMQSRTAKRLILRTDVAEGEAMRTLSDVFPAANWSERETFDMFGIPFAGHPDLTRILLPSEFDGWPMRRDFPCEGSLKFRD